MFVQFVENVVVGGVPYKKGQVVDASTLESGCAESCLRMRRCVECDAPPPAPTPKPEAKPVEPKPRPKASTTSARRRQAKPKEE